MTGYSDAEHDKAGAKIMADIYATGGNLPPVMLGPDSTRNLESLTAQGVPDPGRTDAPDLSIYAALSKAQTDAAIRDIKTIFVRGTIGLRLDGIGYSMNRLMSMIQDPSVREAVKLSCEWVSEDCEAIRAELEKLR